MFKNRNFAQGGGQSPFAVDLINVLAQGLVVFHEVAQSLPADFQQSGFLAVGKNGGGAGHAAQGGDFAKKLPAFDDGGLVFVEDAGNVLEKNSRLLALGAAGGGGQIFLEIAEAETFRFFLVGPQLGNGLENVFAEKKTPAQHGGGQSRPEDHPHHAGQDEKGRGSVIAFAHDNFAAAIPVDAGVMLEDVAQGKAGREVPGRHLGKRGGGEKAVHAGVQHFRIEGCIPALRTVKGWGRIGHEKERSGVQHQVCFGFADASQTGALLGGGAGGGQIVHTA